MKVLLTTPFYCPLVSGSARLQKDVVDHLVASGHSVTVLTYASDSPDADAAFDAGQVYSVLRIASSSRRPVVPGSLSMLVRATSLASTGEYDLLVSGAAYSNGVIAHACSIATRIPLVVYAHGEDVSCVQGSAGARQLLRSALRGARLVMTNSKFTASCVRDLGVPAERVAWCPPGIDPRPYESVPAHGVEALRRRFGLEGKRVILTLARLSERKGHDMVVRALKQVAACTPEVHYLVVGRGDPARLRALAAAEGVGDRLTVVPYVEDSELPALFNLAEVYVMVSRVDPATREVEGFGIVYLEAAASGRPTVGARVGGAVDAIEDGVTGILVDPNATSEIAGAIAGLLSDPSRAAAMGLAGRERVKLHFQKEDTLRHIESLLVQTVGATRRSRSLSGIRRIPDIDAAAGTGEEQGRRAAGK
jgi:phosphatidylinositol alpha-1,6-mannosyltransferase